VRAMIAMAASLGLKVIAEGVEDETQLQILKRLDCAEAQGFLMSVPLPPDQAEAVLRRGFF